LKDYIHGKASELVFNLDEVGSADWEHWKAKKWLYQFQSQKKTFTTQSRASSNTWAFSRVFLQWVIH
jgi:hypothetical protein